MTCPTNPLPDQLVHSAAYGLALLMVGAIAFGLDVFAAVLGRSGASHETVRLLQGAALWLLALDLGVVLMLATVGAWRLVWCSL